MNNLNFSIIIPTYNPGERLRQAINSIISQTYTNYEILIIDNVSRDGTLDVIKNYASLHNNIRWISEPDNGIYDAMNKGVNMANGECLYFLGSDDRLYNSNILQQISNEVTENNCDVIYGDVYSTRFNGKYDGEFDSSKILTQNICHQSVFFKRDVFEITGLFNLRYKSHADWDHNMHWFFSPKISKMYFNGIIAEYADGGFSSLNCDPKFANERILKFLLYGKSQLSTCFRIRLLKQEFKRAANKNNIYYFLRLCINIPRILAGV